MALVVEALAQSGSYRISVKYVELIAVLTVIVVWGQF